MRYRADTVSQIKVSMFACMLSPTHYKGQSFSAPVVWQFLALVMVVTALLGCSQVGSYLDIAKSKGVSAEYLDVLHRYTKKEIVYNQFDTKVQISATYKSNEFNRAYGKEYARIYYLTEAEKKRRDELQSGFAHEFREIFLYAAMADKEVNDLDRMNSNWTIFLVDASGNQVKPLDIRKIEKITPVMEEFFPYVNKYYGNCYSVKFPIDTADDKTGAGGSRPMKIVLAGILGKAELSWP